MPKIYASPIATVSVFRTTDGKQFGTLYEAEVWQANLRRQDLTNRIVREMMEADGQVSDYTNLRTSLNVLWNLLAKPENLKLGEHIISQLSEILYNPPLPPEDEAPQPAEG